MYEHILKLQRLKQVYNNEISLYIEDLNDYLQSLIIIYKANIDVFETVYEIYQTTFIHILKTHKDNEIRIKIMSLIEIPFINPDNHISYGNFYFADMLTGLIDYYYEIENFKENIYIALKNRIRACIISSSESNNNCEMLYIFIRKIYQYSQITKDTSFLVDSVISFINSCNIYDFEANEDYFQYENIFSDLGNMLTNTNTHNIAVCIIQKLALIINISKYLNQCDDNTRYRFSLYNIN